MSNQETAVDTRQHSPSSDMADIAVKNVHKSFVGRDGEVEALRDLNLDIRSGELVALLGPTGCGKSTLLKIIAGILDPDRGEVTIQGRSRRDARKQKQFGFVFQDPALLPWRTALANVRLPLEVVDYPRDEREERCMNLLELVGLDDFPNHHPWELSGGMKQRVAIVRGLAHDPRFLLMDEPFSALDEQTRFTLHLDFLKLWREGQKTVVLVTHSISEALFLADRVVLLSSRPGRVQEVVDVELDRPRNEDTLDSKTFLELQRRLRSLLQDS